MTSSLDAAVVDILTAAEAESPPAGAILAVHRNGVDESAVGGHRELLALTGRADLPMTLETSFDLASITKIFTTVALMRLVSSGDVALDAPLSSWLPTAKAAGDASIRDLLLHRAGLWEWWPLYFEADPLRTLDNLPLRYPRDSGRRYSDLGFVMLGRVVTVAAGQPLESAVQSLVIDPLGLRATRYRHPLAGAVAATSVGDSAERTMIQSGVPYPVPYQVENYSGWRTSVIVEEVNDGNAFHAFHGISGHAGLFSTTADLLELGRALAIGRDELWNPSVAAQFFAAGPDAGQALGFRRYGAAVPGGSLVGHSGYTGSVLGFAPGVDLAIVLATNRLHTTGTPATTERLWSRALEILAE